MRFDEIAAHHEQQSVVLSSEMLSWVREPHELRVLEARLRPHFDEIEIIALVRRQDILAASHAQQAVKPRRNGLLGPAHLIYEPSLGALPPLTPHVSTYLDFASAIDVWSWAFGVKHVHPVHLAEGLDAIDAIAPHLPIPAPDKSPRENVRRDAYHDLFGRILALCKAPPWVNRLAADFEVATRGEALVPSASDAAAFVAHYASGNADLATRGVTFSDNYRSLGDSNLADCLPGAFEEVDRFVRDVQTRAAMVVDHSELDLLAARVTRLRQDAGLP